MFLFVTDLELYDRDIGYTRGYADESLAFLDRLHQLVLDRPAINSVYFIGDLMSGHIHSEEYRAQVFTKLYTLNQVLQGRTVEHPFVVYHQNAEGKFEGRDHRSTRLFAVQGNHDEPDGKPTFFSFLRQTGLLATPLALRYGDWMFNLFHFTRTLDGVAERRFIAPGTRYTVDLYHLPLDSWGVISAHGELKQYNFFTADYNIIAHIHRPNDIITHQLSNGKTIHLAMPGAVARRRLDEHSRRDSANLTLLDDRTRQLSYISVPQKPWKEFFDVPKSLKGQRLSADLDKFTQELQKNDFTPAVTDPIALLQTKQDISPEVKELVLHYLTMQL